VRLLVTRRQFGDALRLLLGPRSQTWLAGELGVSQSAVSQWINGDTEPLPQRVWSIERVCGVEPGTLSRLLGYVPADANGTHSTEAAILADPRLTDEQKDRFVGLFKDLTAPADAAETARSRRSGRRRGTG
jgi:transcriptional regulator with XRE-family HTH domain